MIRRSPHPSPCRPLTRVAAALALLAVSGCGVDGRVRPEAAVPTEASVPSARAALPLAAPAGLRRLSPREIGDSLRDLLGDRSFPIDLPAEPSLGDYDTQGGLGVSAGLAEAMSRLAARAAPSLVEWFSLTSACPLTSRICRARAVEALALRIFRRPAEPAERDRWLAFVELPGRDATSALTAVVEAMLQSPGFLFRTELGGAPEPGGAVRLDPYETASALSYFLWGSAPDRPLLDSAARGELASPAGLAVQATRLLQDDRWVRTFRSFVLQWSGLAGRRPIARDPAVFPGWTPRLAGKLVDEVALFAERAALDPTATWHGLWTGPTGAMDAELAAYYGVARPPGDEDEWVAVPLPAPLRGLLGRGAFVARHTPAGAFSPVALGSFVRRNVLCQPVPAPPVAPVPPAAPGGSARARFAAHAADPTCAACHRLMDPIGFGFERQAALGRAGAGERLAEQGAEEGEEEGAEEGVLEGTDLDEGRPLPFAGGGGLGALVAASSVAEECFAAQLLSFALGRDVTTRDSRSLVEQRSLEEALAAFRAPPRRLRALVHAIATSPALYLRLGEGGGS